MRLTVAQASRLLGVPGDVCARVLAQLDDEGFLQMTSSNQYRLRSSAE